MRMDGYHMKRKLLSLLLSVVLALGMVTPEWEVSAADREDMLCVPSSIGGPWGDTTALENTQNLLASGIIPEGSLVYCEDTGRSYQVVDNALVDQDSGEIFPSNDYFHPAGIHTRCGVRCNHRYHHQGIRGCPNTDLPRGLAGGSDVFRHVSAR